MPVNESEVPKEKQGEGKRAGSAKLRKKFGFEIDVELVIQPEEIPENAKFNGYRVYDVQEIEITRRNIRFQLAEYVNADGSTVVGQLPRAYLGGHYGPTLVGHIHNPALSMSSAATINLRAIARMGHRDFTKDR